MIIIDEAQHLTVRALNHLRCISDESGVGICLIGNDDVYRKMKGSGKADFAQLFSRIGMRKPVLVSNITKKMYSQYLEILCQNRMLWICYIVFAEQITAYVEQSMYLLIQ